VEVESQRTSPVLEAVGDASKWYYFPPDVSPVET
jgi:hypothetical protein